jgi:hypothetical protein
VGTPSRYSRTFGGLIGSMIVTVVVVVAIFLFLRLDNGGVQRDPDTVDYTEAVDAARDAGTAVVHPSTEPDGWRATSVTYEPARVGIDWGIGFLTTSDEFAGVRQSATDDLDDLLTTYVDEDPRQGEDLTTDSPIAGTWSSWSDDGGDHAYAAEVDVDGAPSTILVYGSASTAQLQALLDSLVLD